VTQREKEGLLKKMEPRGDRTSELGFIPAYRGLPDTIITVRIS